VKKDWIAPEKQNPSSGTPSSFGSIPTTVKPSTSTISSANPLSYSGEPSYFFALEKRFICMEKELYFIDSDAEYSIALNIGIKSNGGGFLKIRVLQTREANRNLDKLISLNSSRKCMSKVVFYLKNGTSISCIDRKLRENINGFSYSYYNLTRNENHALEQNEIDVIEFSTILDSPHCIPDVNCRVEKYRVKNSKYCTSCLISDFYKSY
tara:strand:+ start:2922 stop:3548 length:627 start_codon:yes stop_codon:yes gene_type:complete